MSDLTIDPANVLAGPAAALAPSGLAGEAVDAGEWVYLDPTTSRYYLARANGLQTQAVGKGMALNSAVAEQPLRVQTGGQVAVGGTVVVGQLYLVSDTPGKLRPVADLTTGQWVSLAAVGTPGNVLELHPVNTGQLRA